MEGQGEQIRAREFTSAPRMAIYGFGKSLGIAFLILIVEYILCAKECICTGKSHVYIFMLSCGNLGIRLLFGIILEAQ